MPQIIVTAEQGERLTEHRVLLRERVNTSDFESERFAANLLERLGWAVEDAAAAEIHSEALDQHEDPHPHKEHPHPRPHQAPYKDPVGAS